jgi:hypothetical protein
MPDIPIVGTATVMAFQEHLRSLDGDAMFAPCLPRRPCLLSYGVQRFLKRDGAPRVTRKPTLLITGQLLCRLS